jgi:Domain of unknown function (DUF4159)
MRPARIAAILIAFCALLGTLCGFQRGRRGYAPTGREWQGLEWEMQNPSEDPPDAQDKAEWTFARLRYRGPGGRRRGRGGWGTDANKAERQFVQGVRRLSRVHAKSVEQVVDIDSDEMYNWPWLYAVEVGSWYLDEPQAKRLRDYLDRGGFLMVDDFHGTYEWQAFYESLRRVFPDREVVEIENGHPIYKVLYDLDERFQVPGMQYLYSGQTWERDGVEARWRAVYDEKGRMQVAICHNMDLGDAWEWADHPQYPEPFASLAYRIGINYIVYPMTH